LHVKDCFFYASLRPKPALIDQHNIINDGGNKNDDSNAITIAENKIGTNNEFSEMEDQEDFD
ncbi:1748_t:CDS:2, partial [Cetraspora pellucida]